MKALRMTSVVTRFLIAAPLAAGALAASASDIWLYGGRDFTGSFARTSRSEGNLVIGAARSIRVSEGVWEACTGQNFSGECRRLTPGDYRELGGRNGDSVLSVRDVTYSAAAVGYAQPRIQIFGGRDFRGRTFTFEQSVGSLEAESLGVGAVSAIVSSGTWELCTEPNFGGRCQALPPGQYADLGPQFSRIVSVRSLDQPRVAPPAAVALPPPPVRTDPLAGLLGAIAAGVVNNANPQPAGPPSAYPNTYDRTRVEVYTDANFRGSAMTIDNDIDSLRNTGFNDRIQSMRIFGGNWEACENQNYGGVCQVFGPGDYRRLPPQLDRSISSIRRMNNEPNWGGVVPGGGNYVVVESGGARSRHPIWLYEHGNFNGRTIRAVGDVTDLGPSGLNDAVSSVFISVGTWQLCEDSNYRGRCFTLGPGQYNEMPPGMNDTVSSFRRVR